MLAFLLTLSLACAPVLLFLIIGVAMELLSPRQRHSLASRFPGGLWLVIDGLRYLAHRLEHKLFWPIHGVHHSIRELHAANSFAHPIEGLIEAVCVVIPLSLVHASREVVLVTGAITGLQNVIIHAPTRLHLGPLRAIFVDSRFHRIHHSLEVQHHDRNFGFLFSFWDRLFGTAHEPGPDEWPATGVDELPPPRTFAGLLLHPLQHFQRPRRFRRTPG
jgi:sterol desaturase/sphingolipid hydroxylase (fatty acid hydroxylase superfamily)